MPVAGLAASIEMDGIGRPRDDGGCVILDVADTGRAFQLPRGGVFAEAIVCHGFYSP